MNETLENTLRETLAARADEVPASSIERVRGGEYRPRTRDLRPPIAGGVVATAAVAGGLVLTLGLSHPAPAFAGWSAHPTSAPRSQVTDAATQCTSALKAIPESNADRSVSAQSGQPLMPSIDTMTQVVSDTRGPFTFLVYATSDASASCFGGPGFTQPSEYRSADAFGPVASGEIELGQQAQAVHDGETYTFIDGQSGPGVTAVTLQRPDGSSVQTTVENGWYAAWWPGSTDATTASVTTSTGTSTVSLPAPKIDSCLLGGESSDC